MKRRVWPGNMEGTIAAIPSKSHAHRVMILAAMAVGETRIHCGDISDDIRRTADCLRALGAEIAYDNETIRVQRGIAPKTALLPCGESGSTYRFLLPLAAALGVEATFQLEGRLPLRPTDALYTCLEAHGITIAGKGTGRVTICGKLSSGTFELPGHISSQFISGLLMTAPLLDGDSRIRLTSPLTSRDYVAITTHAMAAFGVQIEETASGFLVPAAAYQSPGSIAVEGDWSNAAFWLCGAACGGRVTVTGLDPDSPQGDKAVLHHLAAFGAKVTHTAGGVTVEGPVTKGAVIDIDPTPDLAPALALLALAAPGVSRFQHIARLRMKESDRVQAMLDVIHSLGGSAWVSGDDLLIQGGMKLSGGETDSRQDHRIAMMAACCAALTHAPVDIRDAQAVSKSYPRFFEDLQMLRLRNEEGT